MSLENQPPGTIASLKFVTDCTPYCCWGEIKEANSDFLRNFDPKYFSFQANTFAEQLEGEFKEQAALSIRSLYGHALETFFALLCAAVQAPYCVLPWLLKYKNHELESLVKKISNGETILKRLRFSPVGWSTLAEFIHRPLLREHPEAANNVKLMGTFWTNLATDFSDVRRRDQYNSIKHGMRTHVGPFALKTGKESVPGQPCPPDQMTLSLEGSGSIFHFCSPILGSKHNIELGHATKAWSSQSLMTRIHLLSASLGNIVQYLRILSAGATCNISYELPHGEEVYLMSWDSGGSLSAFNICVNYVLNANQLISAKEILDSYQEKDELKG